MRAELVGRRRFNFSRLHTATDLHHAERLLATARLVEFLVLLYSLHSVGVFVALRLVRVRSATIGVILHALDVVWAVALAILTGSPPSPFFVLLLFVLLSAAFRWRLRETVITGGIVLIALTVQPFLDERIAIGADLLLRRCCWGCSPRTRSCAARRRRRAGTCSPACRRRPGSAPRCGSSRRR
jgi:hypothetical protein